MADYRLTETGVVIRTRDGAFIPNDPQNSDRAEYDRWLALGNVPDPIASDPAVLMAIQVAGVEQSFKSSLYRRALQAEKDGDTMEAVRLLIRAK